MLSAAFQPATRGSRLPRVLRICLKRQGAVEPAALNPPLILTILRPRSATFASNCTRSSFDVPTAKVAAVQLRLRRARPRGPSARICAVRWRRSAHRWRRSPRPVAALDVSDPPISCGGGFELAVASSLASGADQRQPRQPHDAAGSRSPEPFSVTCRRQRVRRPGLPSQSGQRARRSRRRCGSVPVAAPSPRSETAPAIGRASQSGKGPKIRHGKPQPPVSQPLHRIERPSRYRWKSTPPPRADSS